MTQGRAVLSSLLSLTLSESSMTFVRLTIAGISAAIFAGLSTAPAIQAAPAGPSGDMLFRQRCAMCHQSSPSPLGPSLAGVIGRKAATKAFAYSPALKASGIIWTRRNLDRFLTAPMQMVPGTKMVVAVPNGAERTALLNYLASIR